MVVSRQVLVEADRNFCAKLPNLVIQFRRFIQSLAMLMIEDPAAKAVERAASLINRKDAPILAAAMESEADYKKICKSHDGKRKFQQGGRAF